MSITRIEPFCYISSTSTSHQLYPQTPFKPSSGVSQILNPLNPLPFFINLYIIYVERERCKRVESSRVSGSSTRLVSISSRAYPSRVLTEFESSLFELSLFIEKCSNQAPSSERKRVAGVAPSRLKLSAVKRGETRQSYVARLLKGRGRRNEN